MCYNTKQNQIEGMIVLKAMKKLCAIVLCTALLAGTGATGAFAAGPERPSAVLGVVYDIGDFVVKGLIKGISLLFPPAGIPSEFPESPAFPKGTGEFVQEAAPGNVWKLGHASESLLEGFDDAFIKKLYVSGALDPLGKRTVSDVLDPPMTRVTALSDGSGRGTAVFISIDGFGITSVDVGKIRAALADYAQKNNIVSINVSALHQHSTIDTLGMNGNLLAALFCNSLALTTGWFEPFSGKNSQYMENLTKVTVAAVKDAVEGMEDGTLSYSKTDVGAYIRDKRAPEVSDPYFHRLRFVPANPDSEETWLGNAAIHTTGLGTSGTNVSSDWPYFIAEKIKKETGANFQLILGAELAIGMNYDPLKLPEETSGYPRIEAYGNALAQALMDIPENEETALPALLNIAHKEYTVPVDNPLHLLLFRLGAIESNGRKLNCTATKMEVKTEIAYMELGGKIAVALVPGELEPALAYGGGLSAEESYTGKAFDFTPLADMAGDCELLVFGLTNDQVGYILLPNDIAHFLVFGNEELNASGSQLAEKTLEAFQALIGGVHSS